MSGIDTEHTVFTAPCSTCPPNMPDYNARANDDTKVHTMIRERLENVV